MSVNPSYIRPLGARLSSLYMSFAGNSLYITLLAIDLVYTSLLVVYQLYTAFLTVNPAYIRLLQSTTYIYKFFSFWFPTYKSFSCQPPILYNNLVTVNPQKKIFWLSPLTYKSFGCWHSIYMSSGSRPPIYKFSWQWTRYICFWQSTPNMSFGYLPLYT